MSGTLGRLEGGVKKPSNSAIAALSNTAVRAKRMRNIVERGVENMESRGYTIDPSRYQAPPRDQSFDIEIDVGSNSQYSNQELAPPPSVSDIINSSFPQRSTAPTLTSGRNRN